MTLTFWFLQDREGNVGTERKTAGKWECQLKTLHLREKDEVKVFANKAGSTLGQAGGCSNPGNRWSGRGLAPLTAYHPLLPNTQSQYASQAVLLTCEPDCLWLSQTQTQTQTQTVKPSAAYCLPPALLPNTQSQYASRAVLLACETDCLWLSQTLRRTQTLTETQTPRAAYCLPPAAAQAQHTVAVRTPGCACSRDDSQCLSTHQIGLAECVRAWADQGWPIKGWGLS